MDRRNDKSRTRGKRTVARTEVHRTTLETKEVRNNASIRKISKYGSQSRSYKIIPSQRPVGENGRGEGKQKGRPHQQGREGPGRRKKHIPRPDMESKATNHSGNQSHSEQKIERGKAPGLDGITTYLVKDLDEEGLKELTMMIRRWWNKKEIPSALTLARVVTPYKKGGPEKQENYRPTSLLNTFYKIIAAAIQRRLASALDKKLMNTQYGFRKKQEHSRRPLCSQKNAGVRRKSRAERGHDPTRFGKSFR